MSDIVIGVKHRKLLIAVAKEMSKASPVKRRGFNSAAIRLSIEVTHHLLANIPISKIISGDYEVRAK